MPLPSIALVLCLLPRVRNPVTPFVVQRLELTASDLQMCSIFEALIFCRVAQNTAIFQA